ncbi:hypothetical protein ES703_112867 [subsurface metagenome]
MPRLFLKLIIVKRKTGGTLIRRLAHLIPLATATLRTGTTPEILALPTPHTTHEPIVRHDRMKMVMWLGRLLSFPLVQIDIGSLARARIIQCRVVLAPEPSKHSPGHGRIASLLAKPLRQLFRECQHDYRHLKIIQLSQLPQCHETLNSPSCLF